MTQNVLIIGSKRTGKKNDPSVIAQHLQGANSRLVYWEDLTFDITTGRVVVTVDGVDLFSEPVDLVIAFGWYKNGKDAIYRDVAFGLSLVLKWHNITFWNSEMGNQRSTTKLSTMIQLALEGVPVPRTLFSLTFSQVESLLDYPFIAKAASASRGDLNYLVEQEESLQAVKESDAYFLIQPFLENDHDLRIVCFDGKPQLVLRRARQADATTHLNNTSQGAVATWLEVGDLSGEILTLSEKICKIMGREMAGIDLIPDSSSPLGYSCLEVNAIPQLTSGTDSDKKLKALSDVVRTVL